MFGRSSIQTENKNLQIKGASSLRVLFTTLVLIGVLAAVCLAGALENAYAEGGYLTQPPTTLPPATPPPTATPTPTPTPNCSSTSLAPTGKAFPYGGGSDVVNVTADPGCSWRATSNATWISITSGNYGSGSGAVSYTVAANTGTTSRTGTMTIAGQGFTVTQDGQTSTKKSLTIMKQGTGNGSVSASTGIITWSGNTGIAEYDLNTSVLLTAEGDTTSDFVAWSGCDTVAANVCTVNMTAARTTAITFNKKTSGGFLLTVTKAGTGDGTVTPSAGVFTWNGKTATATYPSNTQVVLVAEPDTTSRFVQWTGCDVALGRSCTLNMTGAKGVSVEFNAGRKRVKKDFDGDGKSDILWQNTTTGDVAIWQMNGVSKKSAAFAGRNIPGNWRIKAAEDFDGDGKTDMLWQDINTGDVYVWLMDNGIPKSGAYVARGMPSDWQINLSEDFDGDGKSDILWQDTGSGAVYIWLMNGHEIASRGYVVRAMPQDWYIRAVGDFNGDGKADILWQSKDVGDVFCWLMDGTKMQESSGLIVKGLQPDWQIKAAADYNGDGNSDIYLHSTSTGRDVIWFMDGIRIKGADFVRPKAGTTSPMMQMTDPAPGDNRGQASDTDSWDMKSTGDYNGDGANDMVWQDDSTGDVYMWTMDSSGSSYSGGYVDQGVPADWSIY
ncbi:conserved hypothetical protein, membrane or secreted [Candidatus Magnetobacterium bavaricum]|uniref:BACON domain-containing protein n=1 Tax=Candidatus Magnetobacterium bavaricum TaxID=29290 RepID=A0A0F3GLP2_9BACT|nr:conserved hypothetical protein, membrane or secreted [Candidatus Magnetobacterium bavaricum]